MNTDSMHRVVRLDENEFQELTQEVKETLAENSMYDERPKTGFTVADMWNVQRQARSASSMIRKWSN
jgi:hypothetical protein